MKIQELEGIYHTENCVIHNQIELINNHGYLIDFNNNITNTQIIHLSNEIRNLSKFQINEENDIFLKSIYTHESNSFIHYTIIYIILIILSLLLIFYSFKKCKDYLSKKNEINNSENNSKDIEMNTLEPQPNCSKNSTLDDFVFPLKGGRVK